MKQDVLSPKNEGGRESNKEDKGCFGKGAIISKKGEGRNDLKSRKKKRKQTKHKKITEGGALWGSPPEKSKHLLCMGKGPL